MEKNFLSLIKTCRSVRTYKSESVPSKALDAVLEAGTYPANVDTAADFHVSAIFL